jgi:hypothetical protein
MPNFLTRQAALDMIQKSHGKFFTVVFKKRSTGELREINCRTEVVKHLKGGEKKFSDKEKELVTVYSVADKGYRSIPLEGLRTIKFNGVLYHVGDN